MTIYAIVNALLSEESDPIGLDPVWALISPSAILQGGNPYFVPDFDSRFLATVALAVRIGKLGKGIAPRFAHRYVDAVAPALLFIASGKLARLREQGLPWTPAMSYDRSIAVGKFTSMAFDRINQCDCDVLLESEDAVRMASWSPPPAGIPLEDILASLSRDNTLKTGDMILLGLSQGGPEVRPGLKAILKLNGEVSMRFNIR